MVVCGLCHRRLRETDRRLARFQQYDDGLCLLRRSGTAVYDRRPSQLDRLIHHADRGPQYVSIRYFERLGEAGINPSVGDTGSAHGNALAETINGLYKMEVIHRRALWKAKAAVELATLEWVSWFNPSMLDGANQ